MINTSRAHSQLTSESIPYDAIEDQRAKADDNRDSPQNSCVEFVHLFGNLLSRSHDALHPLVPDGVATSSLVSSNSM